MEMLRNRPEVTAASFLLCALASLVSARAEQSGGILPAERLADWTPGVQVGVPGGIPNNRTNLIDVTKAPFNADNTGQADAQPAIMQALAKAGENDVVYLPAGTYRVNGPVAVNKSKLTIRGDGPGKTIVMAYNSGRGGAIDVYFLTARGGWWDGKAPKLKILGGPKRGATVLSVEDTKALEAYPDGGVGQLCQLSLKNDPQLPVLAPANYDYLRKQKSRIVAKTANSVTIAPGLLFDLPETLEPYLSPGGGYIQFTGVEDLTIDGTHSQTRHAPLMMQQAYGCWVKNVSIVNVPNYHLWINESVQCEVRQCHVAKRNKPMGPDGAGLLIGGCSFILAEDNILAEAFPNIEVNSTSGSVFAYNFCDDKAVQGDLLGGSINTNHAGHNSYNLYEGNVAPKIQCDGYHGSASHDTLFRNWIHGTSAHTKQFWVCVNLNRFTRCYSLVGNVLGRKGHEWIYDAGETPFHYGQHLIYALGFPNMGNGGFNGTAQLSQNKPWADWEKMATLEHGKGPGPGGFQELDLDVRATTLLKGNFNYKDGGVPASEALNGATLPASLYLKAKPAWFGELAWPAFGPDADPESHKIPAQARYEALAK
ncbi:MAG: glycoside hydrolase family 55 protein [Planctomycetota bacterium]|nr:glycoside hydrolase family 55 protein [Planctomycetota bacterium]